MRMSFPSRGCRGLALIGLTFTAISMNSCASRAKVAGSITFDNKPLPAGRITFVGANGQSSDPGMVDNGRYEVTNAPIGECKIKVETMYLAQMMGGIPGMPGGMPGMSGMGPGGMKPAAKGMSEEKMSKMSPNEDLAKMKEMSKGIFVEIPPDYADAEKTPLTFTVKSGGNSHDIELIPLPGWTPGLKKNQK